MTPMEGKMKIIILATTMLIVLGAPAMASQKHNSQYGQVQTTNNASSAGKVRFNEFQIKKTTDKASPVLF